MSLPATLITRILSLLSYSRSFRMQVWENEIDLERGGPERWWARRKNLVKSQVKHGVTVEINER